MMMMKHKIVLIGLILGFLPAFSFAVVDYSRVPSGMEVSNPITINVQVDDISEICVDYGSTIWWVVIAQSSGQNDCGAPREIIGPVHTIEELNVSDVFNLPIPEIGVYYCAVNPECDKGVGDPWEYDEWAPIFTIVPIPPIAILTIADNFNSDTLAYAGQLFLDLSGLIILLIGLPVAFWCVLKVIELVKIKE